MFRTQLSLWMQSVNILCHGMYFGLINCKDACKSGRHLASDQGIMVDVAKSRIPSRCTPAESFWQHVAMHCHDSELYLVD